MAAPSEVNTANAIDHDSSEKFSYFLGQNYPNPANQNTRIDYGIPNNAKVDLVLLDLMGKQIKILVSDTKNAGNYTYELNVTDLAKGIYIYKMNSGNYVEVKRLVVQ